MSDLSNRNQLYFGKEPTKKLGVETIQEVLHAYQGRMEAKLGLPEILVGNIRQT